MTFPLKQMASIYLKFVIIIYQAVKYIKREGERGVEKRIMSMGTG